MTRTTALLSQRSQKLDPLSRWPCPLCLAHHILPCHPQASVSSFSQWNELCGCEPDGQGWPLLLCLAPAPPVPSGAHTGPDPLAQGRGGCLVFPEPPGPDFLGYFPPCRRFCCFSSGSGLRVSRVSGQGARSGERQGPAGC